MPKTILWEIIPLNQPTVTKNCPKCGTKSTFINTGNFRINANQNKIDVWLIYQCRNCKSTWNLTILTRVNPGSIPKDLYEKFLCNDKDLAFRYSFDANLHSRNKSLLTFESLAYEIVGDIFLPDALTDPVQLQIHCVYDLDIRVDRILSEKLGISRSLIKKLGQSGKITCNKGQKIWKEKLSNDLLITFHP